MCGLFAIADHPKASAMAYLGLFALQHRGQESAGIATLDGEDLHLHRGQGLVTDVFSEAAVSKLKGQTALGHVRYSTAGGAEQANIQPLSFKTSLLRVALAHNGNIVNAGELRKELESTGSIVQGTADTELILHLIARSRATEFIDRVEDAASQLVGSFSMVVATPTEMIAVVDSKGFRPLALGEWSEGSQRGWVVASESCAFDLMGARFVRDIAPGEMLSLKNGVHKISTRFLKTYEKKVPVSRCSFEQIYFARPDSRVWGATTLVKREELGAALAKESPVNADIVIAVPDSGVPMAMGYSKKSGIPYEMGFIRNHYVGRTFIKPTQDARDLSVRLKLNPVREVVQGKKIVVIDDSIVRGTTSQKIVALLREAGAKEIHLRIASPKVKFSCFYGIDTPERKDLLAQKMTTAEMQDFLRVDSLAFLSHDSLETILGHTSCTSCFTGRYPDAMAQAKGNPATGEIK